MARERPRARSSRRTLWFVGFRSPVRSYDRLRLGNHSLPSRSKRRIDQALQLETACGQQQWQDESCGFSVGLEALRFSRFASTSTSNLFFRFAISTICTSSCSATASSSFILCPFSLRMTRTSSLGAWFLRGPPTACSGLGPSARSEPRAPSSEVRGRDLHCDFEVPRGLPQQPTGDAAGRAVCDSSVLGHPRKCRSRHFEIWKAHWYHGSGIIATTQCIHFVRVRHCRLRFETEMWHPNIYPDGRAILAWLAEAVFLLGNSACSGAISSFEAPENAAKKRSTCPLQSRKPPFGPQKDLLKITCSFLSRNANEQI